MPRKFAPKNITNRRKTTRRVTTVPATARRSVTTKPANSRRPHPMGGKSSKKR